MHNNGGAEDLEQPRRLPGAARPATTTADVDVTPGLRRRTNNEALVRVALLAALLAVLIGFIVVRDWRNGELGLDSGPETSSLGGHRL